MSIRHLLTQVRRRSCSKSLRALYTSSAVAETSPSATLPSPPAPNVMIYDRLAEAVKEKLKKLENPDSRFLKYNSPYPTLTDHSSILASPLTRVTTLPSGLRIATESNLSSETATVGVWIDSGSRYENDENNGTAHFLEHLVFKGTERRTQRELEEEIENMGGHLNAQASREMTAYFTNTVAKDVSKGLDILADILQNPAFDEISIDRERQVILREMQEVNNQLEEVMFDHLHATAYQYTPLGRTILGSAENIEAITKTHLKDYISSHYTAPRMVIAASGAVKHEDIVEQVKKSFTNLNTESATASELAAKEPSIFTGSEVRMVDDDLPVAQFVVTFEGASWTDPDAIALMVMQSMLGSWKKTAGGGKHSGSELVQRVAINELCESMSSFNANYKDTGLFGVYASAKPECLDDLAYVIMYELSKLCYRISQDDVTRACNQLKSSLLLHMDETNCSSEDIGRQILTYGRRMPYTELFARIDSVDASTIKRVANRFIFDKDVAISAVGPIQLLPDYNWFRRRTYWLRY